MAEKYEHVAQSLAGSLGGVASLGITYPLYTVVSKLQIKSEYGGPAQAIRAIIDSEGIQGLYAGVTVALIGNAYAQGVYYFWYSFFRKRFESRSDSPLGTAANLLIGALAGSLTVIFTNPLWVVTTRMQTATEIDTGKKKGLVKTIREIADEGLMTFWSGLLPSLILVSNPSIQYMVFEEIKKRILSGSQTELSSGQIFLLGAIAKTAATVVTYPYITVKTRLQSKQQYTGMIDVLSSIVKESNILGFYKGMGSKIVQSVLNAAFLFAMQDKFFKLISWLLALAFREK
eukprot:TRINITY_DN13448_c0_g1_i1.p1 TRINITY_DN13448_c0_g1~~TRINITY_DN13448_c0_g1_i1.p1  ORF type:complete len:296 (+),score=38.65 TRINITY_DN13448_c0_g1_i1:27-890(+)